MIDIHSHILPGVDDGAQNLDDSLAMARMAVEDGIGQIVATPHDAELGSVNNLGEVQEMVAQLSAQIAASGLDLKVSAGLEAYMVPDLLQKIEVGKAFTLAGSNYLLVEFPLQQVPFYAEQVLFELQAAGIIPIIAHPERNAEIQKNHSLLEKLVERGMLAQVTAASILGAFGSATKITAEEFLRRNLVHVIASDAHSATSHRAPVLREAVTNAGKVIGQDRALAMVTTVPEAIINGREVQVEPPIAAKPKKSWAFWR